MYICVSLCVYVYVYVYECTVAVLDSHAAAAPSPVTDLSANPLLVSAGASGFKSDPDMKVGPHVVGEENLKKPKDFKRGSQEQSPRHA